MITLNVKGMTCQHCVHSVKKAIGALDGNAKVSIDLPSGKVEVESTVPREALVAAIVDDGYEVAGG